MGRAGVFSIVGRGAVDRRRTAILIGSVVLHAVVLTIIGAGLSDVRFAPLNEPSIYLDLAPTPSIVGKTGTRAPLTPSDTTERLASRNTAPAVAQPRPVPAQIEAGPVPVAEPDWTAPASDAAPTPLTRPVPSLRALCRGRLDLLTASQQAACEDQFAQAASRATRISGTGDPERDALFAAEGDAALAAYERRRAPLTPNSRARPCPHEYDLRGQCDVWITVTVRRKF